jgi:hypothetical protein
MWLLRQGTRLLAPFLGGKSLSRGTQRQIGAYCYGDRIPPHSEELEDLANTLKKLGHMLSKLQ